MMEDKDITPAILLQHMRGMEKRLTDHMNVRFIKVDERFVKVEARLESLENKTSLISMQIKNIDHRLDDIEVGDLPRIRKVLKMRRKPSLYRD